MSVTYSQFQSKQVSHKWAVVLRAAQDAGIGFQLNSGHRTMEQQWSLYNAYKRGSGVLAAVPNKNAPHIRTGRHAHALDIDRIRDGENRLQYWLQSEGAAANNTVPGEAWHLEVSEAGLDKLYRRYRASHDFPNPSRRWTREYDRLLRQRRGKSRRRVLRRMMKQQRTQYFGQRKHLKLYTALLVRSR